ncbi:starch synthase (maltosyl-transferring) [Rhizobiales bacterium GAS113]|nr:starch synthase (maltosyl-transferring) [Rhizobiales bacterium GAS113]
MKIYFVPLARVTSADGVDQIVDHAASLGFDTIASNAALEAASLGVPRCHGGCQSDHRAPTFHDALGEACRRHELALMVDLVLDRSDTPAGFLKLHPEWFLPRVATEAAPPDPRFVGQRPRLPQIRWSSPEIADELVAWWKVRLLALADMGASRFRCLSPSMTPAAIWLQLIATVRGHNPDCAFHAWTPGSSWDDIAALAGLGFAGGFTSSAWWDCRSPWLIGESEVLERIGPSIAFPEPPPGERLPPALFRNCARGIDSGRTAMVRALLAAAATADGILLPMGFEYGASPTADTGRPAEELERLRLQAPFNLCDEVRAANAIIDQATASRLKGLRLIDGSGGGVTVLLRTDAVDPDLAAKGAVILLNTKLSARSALSLSLSPLPPTAGAAWTVRNTTDALRPLEPGEVRVVRLERSPSILTKPSQTAVQGAMKAARIVIEAVSPAVDGGRFPAKRVVGEPIEIEADIFTDGHDQIAAEVLWRPADEKDWRRAPMDFIVNDRWRARIAPSRIGRHVVTIEAWWDVFGTLRSDVEKKRAAGVDVALEVEEARLLVKAALARIANAGEQATLLKALTGLADSLEDVRVETLLAPAVRRAMADADERRFRVRYEPLLPIDIERPKAAFASWYELFPRSITDDPRRHGTFDDVIGRLPAIRAMGFDVLYFPPIHPIGATNRKGRNNSLRAEPGDVGSPYAIGSPDGGHDAIHPALGKPEDFRRLVTAAAAQGLEIALDFAIQCSLDHPWLKRHPGWFQQRPDGSIRYAENPPKKYEDIVNSDFYAEAALPDLWIALRDVVLHWVEQGVRLLRVDNPHTKPLPFWEWMIADVRARHPDVIFLSEAFTRPKMMYRLAKVGFSQSYTYFTWRNTKSELTTYLQELSTTAVKDYFRPHFFVNTPDINPVFLQSSGRPGFLIRAALAATLSGLWGMYSGFELCEAAPLPGREEYLDSEKYEIKVRDYHAPGNIIAEIATLNRLRRTYPALQTHLGLTFYNAFNDSILLYGKGDPKRGELILVAVSLDPYHPQEAMIEIPLWEWGLSDQGSLEAEDLLRGHSFVWSGKLQHLRLDPAELPFVIWRVAPLGGGGP